MSIQTCLRLSLVSPQCQRQYYGSTKHNLFQLPFPLTPRQTTRLSRGGASNRQIPRGQVKSIYARPGHEYSYPKTGIEEIYNRVVERKKKTPRSHLRASTKKYTPSCLFRVKYYTCTVLISLGDQLSKQITHPPTLSAISNIAASNTTTTTTTTKQRGDDESSTGGYVAFVISTVQ